MARALLVALAAAAMPAGAEGGGPEGGGAPRGEAALAAEDRAVLEALFDAGLFDPSGARWVEAAVMARSAFGAAEPRRLRGFRIDDPAWPSGVLVALDLTEMPILGDPPPGEPGSGFAEDALAALALDPEEIARPTRFVVPLLFAHAAWLHRLGDDPAAARLLAHARAALAVRELVVPPETLVREEVAWAAYSAAVNAYMTRADAEAAWLLERLRERAPDRLDAFGTKGSALLAELARRRAAGRLGGAVALPADPGALDPDARAALLVEALEDVDARQLSQPGHVPLHTDRRVTALIALGDAAMPRLLACIEEDERLTRSVHLWRSYARSRTVLAVREAALVAAEGITGARGFELRATGDSFTLRSPEEVRAAAARLRKAWEARRGLSAAERRRAILLDPRATADERRRAAAELGELAAAGGVEGERARALADPTAAEALLASLDRDLARLAGGEPALAIPWDPDRPLVVAGETPTPAGLRAGDRLLRLGGEPLGHWSDLGPVLARYRPGETVEAVVVRDGAEVSVPLALAAPARAPAADDEESEGVRALYLDALVALGDRRIAPALAARASAPAERPSVRAALALACADLGEPAPLRALARAVAGPEGGERARSGGESGEGAGAGPGEGARAGPGEGAREGSAADGEREAAAGSALLRDAPAAEVEAVLDALAAADDPACAAALARVARLDHPLHERLVGAAWPIPGPGARFSEALLGHPALVAALVADLASTRATGARWTRGEPGTAVRTLTRDGRTYAVTHGLDVAWADADLVVAAEERACDHAAYLLAERALGMPRYHPLLAARDAALDQVRAGARRLAPGARALTPGEAVALGIAPALPLFRSAWAPLERAATARDVEDGAALFALGDGAAPLEGLALPATALLRTPRGEVRVLVVQAERDAAGTARYGVLGPGIAEAVGQERLAGLEPVPDPERQREAARALVAAARRGDREAFADLLTVAMRERLATEGGVDGALELMRGYPDRAAEALIDGLAPYFRAGEDGRLRLDAP